MNTEHHAHRTAAPPWAGMTRAQIADFVEGIGGAQAAADHVLSRGHSKNYERNKRYRETHVYGKSEFNEDSFDANDTAPSRGRTRRLAPARLLGMDEWNAILSLAPHDLKDRDVLIASARHSRGETAEIAAEIGICQKQVRNLQDKILDWARAHLDRDEIRAHLDDPITTESVVKRQKSKAGRKLRGGTATTAAVIYDLLGDPITTKPRAHRKTTVRQRQVRVVPCHPDQLTLFQFQEAA